MPSIVIAQGGGPTAVINQTLCGAILAARRRDPSLRILGARYGVRGLTAGNVFDLTTITEAQLRRLGNTPNSALGSTRDKPDSGACADILAALERLDARAFVYIGGNDTAGTLELLRQQSSGRCHFVHAPKTIDNDLMENDHVPGFISAAAFVANALVSMDLDFRAMPGIYVAIVMGRHAGFLSAAAAGWQQSPDDAPNLIYTPEKVPRGYIGVIDETDRKEAFAAGAFAAQSALTGSGSVVLHYDGDRIEPLIVPLERVAGKTRHMPGDFFAGSNTISDEGRRYFRRLLPKRPDIFLPFV
jgi:ATP-dependent phosphofructokinase / diphosphate-dependent phosphofructokinase